MDTHNPQIRDNATAILSQRLADCSGKKPQLSWHADTLHILTRCDSAMICPLLTIPGKFQTMESYSIEEIEYYILSVIEEAEKLQMSGITLSDASGQPVDYPILSFLPIEGVSSFYNPVAFISPPQDTAKIAALFRMSQITRLLPNDLQFHWHQENNHTITYFEYIAVRSIRQPITNSMIQSTSIEFDSYGMANILIRLKPEYHKTWEHMTMENVGRALSLMVDEMVYMRPIVNEKISEGNSILSGNWSIDEAKILASVIAYEPLPCTTRITDIKKISNK